MLKRFLSLVLLLALLSLVSACAMLSFPTAASLDGASVIAAATQNAIWQPPLNTRWQLQFTGRLDLSVNVAMYDNDLLSYFDWALNEQCFQYKECNYLLPFTRAGKAVFELEYALPTSQFCRQANALNFNSMKKRQSLSAWREPCR